MATSPASFFSFPFLECLGCWHRTGRIATGAYLSFLEISVGFLILLRHCPQLIVVISIAPLSVTLDSMHKIKRISAQMLEEKMKDSAVALSDTDAKRDIMSLLVRARKAESEQQKGVYTMGDKAMMDQVVQLYFHQLFVLLLTSFCS